MRPSWKKIGWRSLGHFGPPKVVVRFSKGVGRLKLLSGCSCSQAEAVRLLAEATAFWKQIGGGK